MATKENSNWALTFVSIWCIIVDVKIIYKFMLGGKENGKK